MSTLSFLCLISISLSAMEESEHKTNASSIEIIDFNHQSAKQIIESGSLITIFGATPKISRYEQYNRTLQAHLEQLQQYAEKNRLLKGVNRDIKNAFKNLREQYQQTKEAGQNNIITALTQLPLSQKYDQFFKFGFNKELLQDNMKQLLQQSSDSHYLIHILLPCYFGEIRERLQNGQMSYKQLHNFLQTSAQFYQQNYQEVISTLPSTRQFPRVKVVIPHIDEFKTFINAPIQSREESIVAMTQTIRNGFIEHLSQGKNNTYILIDQDYQEADLITKVAKSLTNTLTLSQPVQTKVLDLYDNRARKTVIFNPYLLKPEGEKEIPYQQSPLVTLQLARHLIENKKLNETKESHES